MIRIRELEPYLCLPTTSIRAAMTRLNASDQLFQLIVDADHVLLGTLTDGDVRRALLRGLSLDVPIEQCMHTEFIAGRVGADAENQALLRSSFRLVNFVPLVDDKGRIAEILVRDDPRTGVSYALVMAADQIRRPRRRSHCCRSATGRS